MPSWFGRADKLPPDHRQPVKLMNEYGVAWPLWGDPKGYEYQPGALKISQTLSAEILAWATNFNLHYSHETGWRSHSQAEAHFDEGHRIAAALQGELGSAFRVELNLWETHASR